MLRSLVFALCFSAGSIAAAGKYNPVLEIGDPAPAWKELPGIDGKQHSLDDLKESARVVVIFTCNSCPYAVDYEKRIKELTSALAGQNTAVVAINVNTNEQDDLAAMKARASEQEFNFLYLYDETQQIARDYGATYTPEFFVLDQKRRVVYMGAMDDSPAADKVTQRYVADAIAAIQQGRKPKVEETVAIGCRIRLERRRRRRRP